MAQTHVEECPECGSTDLVEDNGEIVCRRCGLIVGISFSRSAEWRAFTFEEDEKRRRAGGPEMLMRYDKGLTTVIGSANLNGRGRKIPTYWKFKALKLRKWQKMTSVHGPGEKNLVEALNEIRSLTNRLSLPSSVGEWASAIYRKALKAGLVKGRSISALAAASVYAACRISGVPRSLAEVADACGISKKIVSRTYRLLVNNLNITVPMEEPRIYIRFIINKLNLPAEVEVEATKILSAVRSRFLIGAPRTLAAGAVYYAARKLNIYVTQKDVAVASGVTEVTVRNVLKKITTLLGDPAREIE